MKLEGGGAVGFAVRRPVTMLVGVILVTLFGTLSLERLPIQLTPDIAVPTLTVTTNWPGASPQEVESEILEPQEEALKSLTGLMRMEAEARLERGTVTLELEVGTPIEEALVRVTNLLSQVPEYPQGARQPVIDAADSAGPPLAVITVVHESGEDAGHFRTWLEERVQPRLERIDGVAQVVLFGGRDREVEVVFDQSALAARGLTISHVASLVRAQLSDRSAGDIDIGKRRFLVRTPLSPDEPQGLEKIVLATGPDGAPVRLGDVAEVGFGLRKRSAWVFSDATPSMVFLLFREAGSNVLEVTKQIRAEVEAVQDKLLDAKNLRIEVVSDQVGYIEGALDLVRQNLLVGGALAVVVLLLFLGSIRASAVVSVAIPVCTLGTALGMNLLGRTVNVVSLAGMAFAVGMVVDNAIVVLENIDTWKKKSGVSTAQAALYATKEVWGAILASTLTTAVVFIPIITWQDEVGEILRDIAVAISVAVILSLVVSVFVIPSFANVLLKQEEGPALSLGRITRWADAGRRKIADGVRWVVRSPLRSLAVVAIALASSVGLTVWLVPPMEYLPTGNRAFVFGILVPPPGYSVDEMGEIGQRLQDQVAAHVGEERDGVPALDRSFFAGRPESAFMGAGVKDPEKTKAFLGWYRGLLATVPGVFPIATQASLFGRRVGGGRAIEVELSGSDLAALIRAGGPTLGAIKDAMPDAQVRPIPSLDLGAPEYHVEPKREQLARVGLTASDLALVVDALVDGAFVGEYGRPGEPKVDVVLSGSSVNGGDERGLTDIASLGAAPVGTPSGRVVTLSSLADIEEALGPTVVRRIERSRAITLQVSPPEDIPLEAAMQLIRDDVLTGLREKGVIPPEVQVTLAGTAGNLEQAQARFLQVLLLAVVISFLLMAALFEDFIAPLAVMITVPLAAAGGIIGLRLVDRFLGSQPLDMLTAVGFIILIGVVVNNAILVVDGAVARIREGAELKEAVADAVEGRVRPIFMSALTSLAGLSPLVFFPGSGSELYRGVGAIVLGGLALSTVLTLVVVPAVFSLVWRAKRVAS